MYFVDRNLLEERLQYLESMLAYLQQKRTLQEMEEKFAYERAIQMCIEAILDVGNQMIDGFIMRDPGSYEDIMDIMHDEQVISEQEAQQLIQFIGLRKLLVKEYTQVDHAVLQATYQETSEAVSLFATRIRTYLQEQLGPVSAFLPE